MTNAYLNDALSFFIAEICTQNGQEYKPNTLYKIIIAIQLYFRQSGHFINFLDNVGFEGMRRILDAKMKDLSKQGLGIRRKMADVITEEQGDIMWQKGILGTDTPQKRLDTLIYSLGLHFALRADLSRTS